MEPVQTALLVSNTLGLGWLLYSALNKREKRAGGIILDSCALIDGRIVDIVKSSFLLDTLIIPHFVLRELQMLADGNDSHKRSRARHGLEVAESLRATLLNRVIIDSSIKQIDKTDEQLLLLAKKRHARLCTTDYNLNKVAAVEGVIVLNVNELAQALRPSMLPGEEQEIKILQKGEGFGQGVGYLEDGTMVVVDRAAKLIGTKQLVIIERSLQTVAGKMSFAHLKNVNSGATRLTHKK